jgi:hypothetical protein
MMLIYKYLIRIKISIINSHSITIFGLLNLQIPCLVENKIEKNQINERKFKPKIYKNKNTKNTNQRNINDIRKLKSQTKQTEEELIKSIII